ncbi:MAG: UDP-N-acetylmuramoyl-tripeptide--D-alanyl-D-alanine ligase, partial [Alphaproteobacteria bacterium]
MSTLWAAGEAETATGGKARGAWDVTGISIDTRTIEQGDLFVALKGDSRDGHDFVVSAIEAGAGAALVSDLSEGLTEKAPLLVVEDTLKGLEALGRAARARAKARIVAVTGSAGKTTTKEMLRLALLNQGEVAASAASYNNHWGVPLSLARMARDASHGVFEIGMNHEGEIRALVSLVRPHIAIVTTIAPAHLEYFGTLEAIADAKAEIFEGVEPGGTVILPLDNPQFARLAEKARKCGVANILSFGAGEDADARLLSAKTVGEKQIISAKIRGTRIEFTIGAVGAHIASNAMAVLLAIDALGCDLEQAAQALGGFTPLKGRGVRALLGDIELIDESYNANPASMAAALGLLKAANVGSGGRRVA